MLGFNKEKGELLSFINNVGDGRFSLFSSLPVLRLLWFSLGSSDSDEWNQDGLEKLRLPVERWWAGGLEEPRFSCWQLCPSAPALDARLDGFFVGRLPEIAGSSPLSPPFPFSEACFPNVRDL